VIIGYQDGTTSEQCRPVCRAGTGAAF